MRIARLVVFISVLAGSAFGQEYKVWNDPDGRFVIGLKTIPPHAGIVFPPNRFVAEVSFSATVAPTEIGAEFLAAGLNEQTAVFVRRWWTQAPDNRALAWPVVAIRDDAPFPRNPDIPAPVDGVAEASLPNNGWRAANYTDFNNFHFWRFRKLGGNTYGPYTGNDTLYGPYDEQRRIRHYAPGGGFGTVYVIHYDDTTPYMPEIDGVVYRVFPLWGAQRYYGGPPDQFVYEGQVDHPHDVDYFHHATDDPFHAVGFIIYGDLHDTNHWEYVTQHTAWEIEDTSQPLNLYHPEDAESVNYTYSDIPSAVTSDTLENHPATADIHAKVGKSLDNGDPLTFQHENFYADFEIPGHGEFRMDMNPIISHAGVVHYHPAVTTIVDWLLAYRGVFRQGQVVFLYVLLTRKIANLLSGKKQRREAEDEDDDDD